MADKGWGWGRIWFIVVFGAAAPISWAEGVYVVDESAYWAPTEEADAAAQGEMPEWAQAGALAFEPRFTVSHNGTTWQDVNAQPSYATVEVVGYPYGIAAYTNAGAANALMGLAPDGTGVYGGSWGDFHGVGVEGNTSALNGYGVKAVNSSPSDNVDDPNSPGGVALWVQGAIDAFLGNGLSVSEHAAVMTNTSDTDANVLALHMSGRPASQLVSYDNFITFYAKSAVDSSEQAVGAIEGVAGGITFETGSADFAEWMALRDAGEGLEPGDVVGIFAGRISKTTDGAQAVRVISTAPAVSGNSPGEDVSGHARVALLGQVPVKVRGPVALGDYIVASGEGDGVAVPFSPEALEAWAPADPLPSVVGRAWSASAAPGVKRITVSVGVDSGIRRVHQQRQAKRIAELERQLTEKADTLESMAQRLDALDRRFAALEAGGRLARRD